MSDVKVRLDRFESTVCRYEEAKVEEGMILFTGSSGFTRWSARYGNKPLEECIVGKNGEKVAVNHGFGGSTVEELLYYYPRLVKPWKPRAIVLSTFINDRTSGYAPAEQIDLLKRFCAWARVDMPNVKFFITDVRPNAKHIEQRDEVWDTYCAEINALVRDFCDANEDCTFLEISKAPMYYVDEKSVGDSMKVRRDIFIEDKMHYTPEGYELFTEYFLKELQEIL